jgi:hypothetical protein
MGYAGARTSALNAKKAAEGAQIEAKTTYERAVAEALAHLSDAVAQIALKMHQDD